MRRSCVGRSRSAVGFTSLGRWRPAAAKPTARAERRLAYQAGLSAWSRVSSLAPAHRPTSRSASARTWIPGGTFAALRAAVTAVSLPASTSTTGLWAIVVPGAAARAIRPGTRQRCGRAALSAARQPRPGRDCGHDLLHHQCPVIVPETCSLPPSLWSPARRPYWRDRRMRSGSSPDGSVRDRCPARGEEQGGRRCPPAALLSPQQERRSCSGIGCERPPHEDCGVRMRVDAETGSAANSLREQTREHGSAPSVDAITWTGPARAVMGRTATGLRGSRGIGRRGPRGRRRGRRAVGAGR